MFKYFYMAKGIMQSVDKWQIWQIILVVLVTRYAQKQTRRLKRNMDKVCKEVFTEKQL